MARKVYDMSFRMSRRDLLHVVSGTAATLAMTAFAGETASGWMWAQKIASNPGAAVPDIHGGFEPDGRVVERLWHIHTVAMESTGVYWIPVCQILEDHGIEAVLVNAAHAKNVSGRKSDAAMDCWRPQSGPSATLGFCAA